MTRLEGASRFTVVKEAEDLVGLIFFEPILVDKLCPNFYYFILVLDG